MVSLGQLLSDGASVLGDLENPRFEAEFLLTDILGKDRIYLVVHKNDTADDEVCRKFLERCKRRATGEPSAYITGRKEFMGLEFHVCSDVLIPRPETELIVEAVIDKYKDKPIHVLDICTGSGAIACSIAHFLPKAHIVAADISLPALAVARRNAENLGCSDRTEFIEADALCPIDAGRKFDLVVSNPPYIESETIATLDKDVRDFEPHIALDGGKDGLIFYRSIVNNIESIITKGGELIFETGFNQGDALKEIMKNKFRDVTVTKDLAGLDRMVSGTYAP